MLIENERKSSNAVRVDRADMRVTLGKCVPVLWALLLAVGCQSSDDLGPKARRALESRTLGSSSADALRELRRDIASSTTAVARQQAIARGIFVVNDGRIDVVARAAALRDLGGILEPTSLRRVEPFLRDEALAEAALFAIARVPGEEASRLLVRELVTREHGTQGEHRLSEEALVHALARREDTVAHAALLERATSVKVGPVARRGLARHGVPVAGGILERVWRDGKSEALSDYLLWLERASTAGVDRELLRRSWRSLLRAEDPRARRAAFLAMLAERDADREGLAIEMLGDADARVRAQALRCLVDAEPLVQRARIVALARGFGTSVLEDQRASIAALRVLAERGDPASRPLLEKAAESDKGARVAALSMLADAPRDADAIRFAQALESDLGELHDAAVRGLSTWAKTTSDSESIRKIASLVLQRVGSSELSTAQLGTLLGMLARHGDASSLELLSRFDGHPELRDELIRIRVSIAGRIEDKDQADAILREVLVASTDRGTRQLAARTLAKRGEDIAAWSAKRGCLTTWHVLGPFGAPKLETFKDVPFAVKGIDVEEPVVIDGKPAMAWQERVSRDIDGVIDLQFLKNSNATAYAFTTIRCAADEKLQLLIGSDDQVAVWLDGRLVHENFASRGLRPDQDRVALELPAGTHELLLKIGQGGGGWEFCVRLVDADGAPVQR